LARNPKNLIVGLDAGAGYGVAILDTEGKLISVTTIRHPRRGDIIKHILKFGRPVIIASDVSPLPQNITKLAAALGSRTYYPPSPLKIKEKQKLLDDFKKEFPDLLRDSHQKDSLAAALKAFRVYHGLFVRLGETLEKEGQRDKLEELISILLIRHGKNITDSIRNILKKK
jgi:hypothetical protein